MALGGWDYTSYEWAPPDNTGASMLAALDEFLSAVGGVSWSVNTAAQYYGGTSRCWGVVTNGSVAITIAFSRESGTAVEASNSFNGETLTNYPTLYFAYGNAPSTGDPSTVGFLSGSMHFSMLSNLMYATSGDKHLLHTFSRGNNLVIAIAEFSQTNSEIDRLMVMGPTFTELQHAPADTGVDAQITWDMAYIPPRVEASQCLQVVGTRVWDLSYTHLSALLDTGVIDRSPYAWSGLYVYNLTRDLDNEGIVPGNGEKGLIDPEMLRIVADIVPEMTPVAGGDMFHLRRGFCIGFDSSYTGLDP